MFTFCEDNAVECNNNPERGISHQLLHARTGYCDLLDIKSSGEVYNNNNNYVIG